MIRKILARELDIALFSDFHRHQQVNQCWRKVNDEWIVMDNPFTEDWGEKEFRFLVEYLKIRLPPAAWFMERSLTAN